MKSKYNIIYIRLYYSDIMSEKNRRSRKKILHLTQKKGGWQPNSKKSSSNNTRKTRIFYSQGQGKNKKVTKNSNVELPRFLNKPENYK